MKSKLNKKVHLKKSNLKSLLNTVIHQILEF